MAPFSATVSFLSGYIVSEDDAAVYELMVSSGVWWFLGRSGDRKVFDVALTSTISRWQTTKKRFWTLCLCRRATISGLLQRPAQRLLLLLFLLLLLRLQTLLMTELSPSCDTSPGKATSFVYFTGRLIVAAFFPGKLCSKFQTEMQLFLQIPEYFRMTHRGRDTPRDACMPKTSSIRPIISIEHRLVTDRQAQSHSSSAALA